MLRNYFVKYFAAFCKSWNIFHYISYFEIILIKFELDSVICHWSIGNIEHIVLTFHVAQEKKKKKNCQFCLWGLILSPSSSNFVRVHLALCGLDVTACLGLEIESFWGRKNRLSEQEAALVREGPWRALMCHAAPCWCHPHHR